MGESEQVKPPSDVGFERQSTHMAESVCSKEWSADGSDEE